MFIMFDLIEIFTDKQFNYSDFLYGNIMLDISMWWGYALIYTRYRVLAVLTYKIDGLLVYLCYQLAYTTLALQVCGILCFYMMEKNCT